jgi:hypothetical protein
MNELLKKNGDRLKMNRAAQKDMSSALGFLLLLLFFFSIIFVVLIIIHHGRRICCM